MYRGTKGAPETILTLSKKEPLCKVLTGSSYDTLDRADDHKPSPQRGLFSSNLHRAHHHDHYCLFVSVQLEHLLDETAAGVSVPSCAMTDKIIRLYLNPVLQGITQVVILPNTDILIYKGHRLKDDRMAYGEAAAYIKHLVGS